MVDFDLKRFVDGLKLTPDQRAVVDTAFAVPENLKYVGDGVLQKADYSRSMNELTETRQQLEAEIAEKEEAIQTRHNELEGWKVGADTTLQTAIKEREDLKQKLAELSGIPPKPADKLPDTSPADARYVKAEDFTKAVKDVMQFPLLSAELVDLNAEHFDLFGKPLHGMKKLVDDAIKEKRTIRDQWSTQYKVEEKRAEMAKKAHDDEIAQARAEERTKVLSEHSLPATRPDERPLMVSPLMAAVPTKVEETKRPDPMRGVKAGVAAYNQALYRPEGPKRPNQ